VIELRMKKMMVGTILPTGSYRTTKHIRITMAFVYGALLRGKLGEALGIGVCTASLRLEVWIRITAFHQHGVLSTRHFINTAFHQHGVSLTRHFINTAFQRYCVSTAQHFMHFINTAFNDTAFNDTAFNDTAFNDTAFNNTAFSNIAF
jgi:hypothetical protein